MSSSELLLTEGEDYSTSCNSRRDSSSPNSTVIETFESSPPSTTPDAQNENGGDVGLRPGFSSEPPGVATALVQSVSIAGMTTFRSSTDLCPDIASLANTPGNMKKSEPALGTSHDSPTLQLSRHSSENIRCPSPSTLSPEHSPKASSKSSEMKLTHLTPPPRAHSPSPTCATTNPLCSPDVNEKFIDSTDASSAVVNNNNNYNGSLNDSHMSLDRTSESSVRSQDSTAAPQQKTTPDHPGLSSSKSEQLCKSEKSDKPDKGKGGEKKKKSSSWYNMLNPSYKSRSEDFKRLFKDLPEAERLIVDYSCALQRDILVHGRLYVTQNFICFYANIFRWETNVVIRCRDVTSMTKEKTARVIPNAIQVCTEHEKHFFTSFGARDKTYLMLFRIWQNALMEQPMTTQELWQWVHYSYGDELGLTSDDDDYVAPPYLEDDSKNNNQPPNKLAGTPIPPKDKDKFDTTPSGGHETDESTTGKGNATSLKVALWMVDSNRSLARRGKEALAPDATELEENSGDAEGQLGIEDGSTVQNTLGKLKSSEYPTDMSDTTESDALGEISEIQCPSPTHEGKEALNIILPISVDQLFTLLFTGSRFFHDLLTSRKTYDITESNWQPCQETGHKLRQVTYTITLNHAMAKTAQTTETQILLKQSKPGLVYAIDCDVLNAGIPYSDTFCVKSHYCLTRISNSQSRLRVFGCIRYKKSVWGLVKSVIEKNAMQGLQDFCSDLDNALQREAERLQPVSKKTRRRKRIKSLIEPKLIDSEKELFHTSSSQTAFRKYGPTVRTVEVTHDCISTNSILKGVLVIMALLVFLNIVLVCKLWVSSDSTSAKNMDVFLFDHAPTNTEEWAQLLRHREAIHKTETEKWKESIGDMIKLIRMIEGSLLDLKSSLDTYRSYPDSKKEAKAPAEKEL